MQCKCQCNASVAGQLVEEVVHAEVHPEEGFVVFKLQQDEKQEYK
jgi:hypothetical protein